MYKVTLNDGTVIDNLTLNGNNYISQVPIREEVFTDRALRSVEIYDSEEDKTVTLTDAFLVQLAQYGNEYWFILAEKTPEMKEREFMQKSMDATEEAITEIYEMILGGE